MRYLFNICVLMCLVNCRRRYYFDLCIGMFIQWQQGARKVPKLRKRAFSLYSVSDSQKRTAKVQARECAHSLTVLALILN